MLKKIKRQECFATYPLLPWYEIDFMLNEEHLFFPKVINAYLLLLPSRTFRGHASASGKEMAKLMKHYGAHSLVFIGDHSKPWLYQQHDYPPVLAAKAYLADNGIGKRFNGGIEVPIADLPQFAKHLAWLTRCCAALPCFHFIDPSSSIAGYICKHGCLHVYPLTRQGNKDLKAAVSQTNFYYAGIDDCRRMFGNAIPGRQTIV